MKRLILCWVFGLAADASGNDVARERINALIDDSGAEVSVAFRTADGEQELLIEPDEVYHAASTMKVPVMIELFRQADDGRLALDDALEVTEFVLEHHRREPVRAQRRRRFRRRRLRSSGRDDDASRAMRCDDHGE